MKSLSKFIDKDFRIFTLCLCLSALFWYIVSLSEETEMDFDVKVTLNNVPDNVVITSDPPATIKVTLKDRVAQLYSYKYSGDLPELAIDFGSNRRASGHVVLKNADVVKMLTANLQSTTRLIQIKPEVIDYYYNHGRHAKFPTQLRATLEAEKLYGVASTQLKPDSVVVYGPKSILDTLKMVYTKNITLRHLAAQKVCKVGFEKIKGVRIEPMYGSLTIRVDRMTEKTVEVPVKWVNFPASKSLRTFPSTVKVTFQVGMNMYKTVSPSDFLVLVSYEDTRVSTDGKLHLSLKSQPSYVSHARIIPESVDFLIEDVEEEN